MDVYIPLGLFLALICFAFRRNIAYHKQLYFFVFFAILIFSAIRFGFGPDYFSYRDVWIDVRDSDIDVYKGVGSSIEPLFLRLLQMFSKYTYFIVSSTFLLISSYYLFFKKYVDFDYLWLIVLFLFFNNNCLLGNYVAMRTMICSCLFIIAFYFLSKDDKKGKVLYVLIILLASRIHASSIVLLVLVLLNTKNDSLLFKWYFYVPIGLLSVITVLFGNNFVVSWISSFLIDNVETFDRYQEYEIGSVSSSLMAVVFRLLSFIIVSYLVYSAKNEKEKSFIIIYKIAIIAALIQLFFGQSLISDRYLMIFNPFYIAAIARSFLMEKRVNIRLIVTILVMGISVYLFNVKIGKDYSTSFLHYETVFTQSIIP